VLKDNPKLMELLVEAKKHVPDHEDYAKALMKGIKEVLE
jgi:hypothetical protein